MLFFFSSLTTKKKKQVAWENRDTLTKIAIENKDTIFQNEDVVDSVFSKK